MPRLRGIAILGAIAAVIGVPTLVALAPPWLRRWTVPMLAVTSMGVWATVPDTEHVFPVMLVVVVAGIAAFVIGKDAPGFVAAGIALVIVVAALADSAGRAAPIGRAAGCFAALLVVPIVQRIADAHERGRPPIVAVLVSHGLVAVFASRALIRDESPVPVTLVIAVALAVQFAVLYSLPSQ